MRRGDVAAFAVETDDGEDVIVLVECRTTDAETRDAQVRAVQGVVQRTAAIECKVKLIDPKGLPQTSSGKLSRARAKTNYVSGVYGPPVPTNPAPVPARRPRLLRRLAPDVPNGRGHRRDRLHRTPRRQSTRPRRMAGARAGAAPPGRCPVAHITVDAWSARWTTSRGGAAGPRRRRDRPRGRRREGASMRSSTAPTKRAPAAGGGRRHGRRPPPFGFMSRSRPASRRFRPTPTASRPGGRR